MGHWPFFLVSTPLSLSPPPASVLLTRFLPSTTRFEDKKGTILRRLQVKYWSEFYDRCKGRFRRIQLCPEFCGHLRLKAHFSETPATETEVATISVLT